MDPLRFERAFDKDVDTLWGYLVESANVTEWLCLRAWIDPYPRGRYELFWNPDEALPERDSTLGCRILKLEAPRVLEVSWRGADEVAAVMNELTAPKTTVRFELTPTDTGTRLLLTHAGWGEGADWADARAFFMRSWSAALRRLEALLAS